MTETACRWNGTESPRVIPGRHDDLCAEETCRGCQPCPDAHCRVCHRAHSFGTCAECMAETRSNLREIGRMCDSLPEEVENRGIDGEAMMLLGPSADPEAWGHVEASLAAGRLSPEWVEVADHELHPAFVLHTWRMMWVDALEQEDANGRQLADSLDYLDRTMAIMGGHEHLPFEDFAKDLRRCVAHLERVLHDGEQVDRGAPCMACGATLERTWGKDAEHDGWMCPRCRQTSTEDQYRFAVAHLHREEATHLTDRDMEVRTGVKAGTVRSWARKGMVRRKIDSGRTVYAVEDVLNEARRAGLVA